MNSNCKFKFEFDPRRGRADRGAAQRWRMTRRSTIAGLLVVAGLVAGLAWWLGHRGSARSDLTPRGTGDLRQVALAFNGNERIAAVLVQEGDLVRQGQLLGRLDTSRLEPQVAQAEAQVAA